MKCAFFSLLFALVLGGCSDPAVEYGSAVSAIRNMKFSMSFLKMFGDDCLVTATYYDGTYGPPGAVVEVVYDRRYQVSAHCKVKYSSDFLVSSQVSSWEVVVTEIVKAEMNSHGTATTYFGRTWRYTEQEWEKIMLSKEGFSSLRLPSIPEASGDGIKSVEKQYGRSSSGRSSGTPDKAPQTKERWH